MNDLKHRLTRHTTIVPVEVPDFGTVHLRSVSVGERQLFWDKLAANPDEKDQLSNLWLLVFTLCDEAGERIFGDDDWDKVKDIAAPIADFLWKMVNKFNLFSIAADDAKKN